jgi:hypothetical protein
VSTPVDAAGCRQSRDRPSEFVLVHVVPWFGLPWQTPVHGLCGVPEQAAPVTDPLRQIGHGWLSLPVSTTRVLSDTVALISPVDVSTVPVAGAAKVFSTQVESPAFAIGSGAPNRHPVFVQSNVAPAVIVGPSAQVLPLHDTVNRLVDPSGVVASETGLEPPPMSSPPQLSVSMSSVNAVSAKNVPQSSVLVPVVKSRNDTLPPGAVVVVVAPGPTVVVVVLDDGETHVQASEQVVPSGHTIAPAGELGSHCSPGSRTPFPQPGVGSVVVVEPPGTHLHVVGSQVSPDGHVKHPEGELVSQSSFGSSLPLPHVDGCVVVVVLVVVVVMS